MTMKTKARAECRAARPYRLAMLFGAVAGAFGTVETVARMVMGSGLTALQGFSLVGQVYMAACFGWMSYDAWRCPVVRIGDDTIRWRAVGSRRWQEVGVVDVTGTRWQDSFDLRLRTRSGEEHSLHLHTTGQKDRDRLAAVLNQMFGSGSLVT